MLMQCLDDCAKYFVERFPNGPLDGTALHLQSYYKINGDGKIYVLSDFKDALIRAMEGE